MILTRDDIALVSELALLSREPHKFARAVFPWNSGELTGSTGPRQWQKAILQSITEHLQNKATRHTPCQIAVSSGHGIGKSALVAQIMLWALSTCEDTKIVVTANTATQLSTKTWPEVTKWFRLAENAHLWKVAATSVKSIEQSHDETWRADAITWSENNTEAFAGLHNKGKRIVLIFDEASAIADKVWETAEGALTDEDTEIIWLAFGNPTQNSGRFRECFGSRAHRWKTFQIDSRQVEGTNKQQIAEWEADYGEDSDFFRVRVRGVFPRAGSNQFIPSDVVAACRRYKSEGHHALPRVLSVDVARFGDDRTAIGDRQGRLARILGKYRGLDTVQTAAKTIEFIQQAEAEGNPYDGVVVDGDGIGAGVVDQLVHRGFSRGLFEFHGGAAADDANKYFNRRAEIWGLLRDALAAGMEIPDDPELDTDLTGPQYGFSSKQQIQLEKKDDMKKRGLSSPDLGDMLAMTFGVKLAPRNSARAIMAPNIWN